MLEQRGQPDVQKPCHLVIIRVGESYEGAAARYVADNGQIDNADDVIRIKLVAATAKLAA